MISFLQSVYNTVSGIIEFTIHGIGSILNLLTKIPQYISILAQLIGNLPSIYQGMLLATIGVSVIFLITGRGK